MYCTYWPNNHDSIYVANLMNKRLLMRGWTIYWHCQIFIEIQTQIPAPWFTLLISKASGTCIIILKIFDFACVLIFWCKVQAHVLNCRQDNHLAPMTSLLGADSECFICNVQFLSEVPQEWDCLCSECSTDCLQSSLKQLGSSSTARERL